MAVLSELVKVVWLTIAWIVGLGVLVLTLMIIVATAKELWRRNNGR